MTQVTSAKPLAVKNGVFTLYNDAPRVQPPQKRGTKVYGPLGTAPDGRTIYSLEPIVAPPPVVVPPVVVPPTEPAALTLRMNSNGAIMSLVANGVEYVAVGAAIEGAMVGYNGSTVLRQISYSPNQSMPVGEGMTYAGGDANVQVEQTVTLSGRDALLEVALTLTKPLTDVRYMRFGDFNPSDSKLALASVEPRKVTMGKVSYTSDDPAAVFFVADRLDPRSPYQSLPAATTPAIAKACDRAIGIGKRFGNLPAGRHVFAFKMSVA